MTILFSKLRVSAMLMILFSTLVCAELSFSEDLILNSALTISVPTTYDSVIIQSGGVLTADDTITVLGNMVIESGGIVTHSLRLESGLILNVTDTLDVQSGGYIDVKAKGLRGGYNGSAFGASGEAFDASDQIVAGSGGGGTAAGASYGGRGANGTSGSAANDPYGLIETPQHLGSGGGGGTGFNGNSAGGHGGGRITISAANLIVDGTLRANGNNGSAGYARGYPGGGSGGAILIYVSNLSGSGAIQAMGGTGFDYYTSDGGSGGGGRIAIYYDNFSLPNANIVAYRWEDQE